MENLKSVKTTTFKSIANAITGFTTFSDAKKYAKKNDLTLILAFKHNIIGTYMFIERAFDDFDSEEIINDIINNGFTYSYISKRDYKRRGEEILSEVIDEDFKEEIINTIHNLESNELLILHDGFPEKVIKNHVIHYSNSTFTYDILAIKESDLDK